LLVSRSAEVRWASALASFETYDAVAGLDQDVTAAVPDISRHAEAALRLR
jgi:hypothetical protein